jgi:short-subunit dehydrogenase
MQKKTILITGAGSGIGRDAALALAGRGHKVIATTETHNQTIELSGFADREKLPLSARVLNIDFEEDRKSIEDIAFDVLINSAAIGESGPLSEVPLERMRKSFETNVINTIALTQIALGKMIAQKSGTVITISSLAGRIPSVFMGPYSMTKFALSGGMAAMRKEVHTVAPHVHVTLVEPGAYATGFNQRMFATKYEWIQEGSAYFDMVTKLRREDYRFSLLEKKSTEGIVLKIIQAAESKRPRLRYSSPWYQAFFVWVMRVMGR